MTRRNKRVTTSGAWIEHGAAAPWMLLYTMWLAQQPEAELTPANGERAKRGHRPTTMEREAKATALARRRIDRRLITKLERRGDIRDYFERLRADAQFQAAELMRADIAENIEARRAGLRAAAGRVEMPDGTTRFMVQDHKAVEHYTRPIVDLAFPKKPAEPERPPTIVLNLGPGVDVNKLLEPQGDVIDIEWEEIPRERLNAGDNDDC